MPEIVRFYGIIIKLFFSDHPPPHFHAIYGEYNRLFSIENLDNDRRGFTPSRQKNGRRIGTTVSTRIVRNVEYPTISSITTLGITNAVS